MTPLKILVVDDHIVVRTGLKSLLATQPEITVAGEAENGQEALAKAKELRPDVIIMDITMPVMDGIEATRRIVADNPAANILALTVHEDKQFFCSMLAAGARGYISKQAASQDLVAAIRHVAGGATLLQPHQTEWLVEEYRRLLRDAPKGRPATGKSQPEAAESDQTAALRQREIQVVELVAAGFTTPEIAEKLQLSPKTVSRHRERIMQKLNVRSSVELVKFALRTGIARLG
ncbi:MAG TPA: response regulator transcription factor [Desulfurivibrionaceae bacterium]|nr:response regulator transcription factor [Desulfurivibrionaceae bacterium]